MAKLEPMIRELICASINGVDNFYVVRPKWITIDDTDWDSVNFILDMFAVRPAWARSKTGSVDVYVRDKGRSERDAKHLELLDLTISSINFQKIKITAQLKGLL